MKNLIKKLKEKYRPYIEATAIVTPYIVAATAIKAYQQGNEKTAVIAGAIAIPSLLAEYLYMLKSLGKEEKGLEKKLEWARRDEAKLWR